MSLRRYHYCLGLSWLLLAAPLAAQSQPGDAPVEWRADASTNKQAQKAAEKAAENAMPPPAKGAPPDRAGAPPRGGGPAGQGGPPSGGMGGGPDGAGPGGKGGPGSPGGPPGRERSERASPASMLRPEMAFAAPLENTLMLYRSRESVLFGSKDSSVVTILPLSGAAVAVAPGVEASVHEDAGGLRVEVVTSNAIKVTYRYHDDAVGVLRVDVVAEGPVPHPGSRFEVTRRYTAEAAH